jgi:hypothetical protein
MAAVRTIMRMVSTMRNDRRKADGYAFEPTGTSVAVDGSRP